MYGQLASIREVVNLSPEETLDHAEAFLLRLGYTTLLRDDTSLVAKRDEPGRRPDEEGVLNLKVVAHPQPGGGVLVKVRGNDRKGVREHQAEWVEWAESLPKKQDPATSASETETHELTPAREESAHEASATERARDALSSDAGDRGEDAEDNNSPDTTPREGMADSTGPGL